MIIQIEIADQTYAALQEALLKIQTQEPGENPGEVLIRPIFPDPAAWLKEIIMQNISQHVPTQPDAEERALIAQAEALQKQAKNRLSTRMGISVSTERVARP